MNKRAIGSNLAKVDAHVITQEEYDEIPEWTDEMFDKAIYRVNGVEMAKPPRRGRPPIEKPKVHTRLRIDADVLDRFKADGPGWQTRINAVLRASLGEAN